MAWEEVAGTSRLRCTWLCSGEQNPIRHGTDFACSPRSWCSLGRPQSTGRRGARDGGASPIEALGGGGEKGGERGQVPVPDPSGRPNSHLVRRRAQVHHLERSSAVPVEVKPTGVGTTRPTLSTATLRFVAVDRVLVWQIGGRSGGGGRAGHENGRKNGRKERHGRGRGRHADRQVTL